MVKSLKMFDILRTASDFQKKVIRNDETLKPILTIT